MGMTTGSISPRKAAASLLALTLAIALGSPGAARAGTPGISGTVEDGAGRPASGVPVTIVFFNDQGRMGLEHATSAADGTFRSTPPSAATGYQIEANYDGATYTSASTQLLAGQPSVATVTVYSLTDDPKDVSQSSWIVWIDTEKSGIAVQEDFEWTTSGKDAYIGKDGASAHVLLPAGATDLQFLGTFLGKGGDVKSGMYVSTSPITPGVSSATLRFSVPEVTNVPLRVDFPTTGFQLFAPSSLTVAAPGLRLAGTMTDQGVTYQVYAADSLQASTSLDVRVSASSSGAASGAASGSDSGSTTWLVGLAALAAAAATLSWLFGRRRPRGQGGRKVARRSAGSPRKSSAGARPASRTAAPGRRPEPVREASRSTSNGKHRMTREDMDLIIDEIAALDLSHDQGLLDVHTYSKLRVAAKDRFIEAQRQLEDVETPGR